MNAPNTKVTLAKACEQRLDECYEGLGCVFKLCLFIIGPLSALLVLFLIAEPFIYKLFNVGQ